MLEVPQFNNVMPGGLKRQKAALWVKPQKQQHIAVLHLSLPTHTDIINPSKVCHHCSASPCSEKVA
ncbi:hypothetical protein DEO72_LG4g1175 [Vigna unguiculata]|uniref:Uncharacterized protein n=1 Tax=Vigna unguiculata TaxID=3917 RepID=A0A4D6LNY8_VIGUN|nr:hypothetical protein DEO72_LG4g1175 [Vigna unguiculata]